MAAVNKVLIMDTTLRDGEQTQGVSYSASEKLDIAKALLKQVGVDRIEIASAGVSEGEQQAVKAINQWAETEGLLNQVEVLGFINGTKSVDWIVQAGGKVLNLLVKGSEKHCQEQLNQCIEQHISLIRQTIDYALQQDLSVNVYLEDWSNGYKDKPEYVFELMDALVQMPIVHFMLPDTLGVMSPDEVFEALSDMKQRYPQQKIDFHPHNDYGLALANVMAAIRAGISSIHCTVNCLGERAGNASLAEVAVVLKDKLKIKTNINEKHIFTISEMVANYSGKLVAPNTPIVGSDVFTQTAGIHADGDNKAGLYETKLSPDRFMRKRSYALGKLSGKASLIKNLKVLGIELEESELTQVLQRIVERADAKEIITTEDLPFIIADVRESAEYQSVKLLDCEMINSLHRLAKVSISIDINGKQIDAISEGNGSFDAFIHAIDKALTVVNYQLPKLLDYRIRIPRGGQTNALTECTITWDTEKQLKTRGVHANQVIAGINATLRLINIQMQEIANLTACSA